MKSKGFTRYTSLDEFKDAIRANLIEVGDELVTEDIDGKAIFQVADIRKNKIIMVRKFCLVNRKPMNGLYEWLNGEYLGNLSSDLIPLLKAKKDNYIFLPKEVEVFGEHIYSSEDEKGRQWAIFKKTKQKIRLYENKYGRSAFWWESSPYVGNSTHFCHVNTLGTPDTGNAGYAYGVLPCFIISLKSLKSDA